MELKKAVAVINDYLNREYNTKDGNNEYYARILNHDYIHVGYKSPCSDGYFYKYNGVCHYDDKNGWCLYLGCYDHKPYSDLMNQLKKLTNK